MEFMTAFLLRWLVATGLVLATFNPSGYDLVQWGTRSLSTSAPIVALAGIVILIGYIIFLRATFRSIGPVGILLVAALLGAVGWVLVDLRVLSLQNTGLMIWLGLLSLSFILAVGLSWSHVRRALSGQSDMDDVDE